MELLEQQSKVLEQFAAGELAAFETLFRQFQGEVYGWIVGIVRDPAAAEDLTVETFWRIYRAHTRFDPVRSFGAWARRIATNVALDHLKKRRVQTEEQIGEREARLAHKSPATLTPDPGVQREMRERMQQAFQQLPAKLQVVATLALIDERPQSEIAQALNISTAAVKSRLFRATQLLRRKLRHLGAGHE